MLNEWHMWEKQTELTVNDAWPSKTKKYRRQQLPARYIVEDKNTKTTLRLSLHEVHCRQYSTMLYCEPVVNTSNSKYEAANYRTYKSYESSLSILSSKTQATIHVHESDTPR